MLKQWVGGFLAHKVVLESFRIVGKVLFCAIGRGGRDLSACLDFYPPYRYVPPLPPRCGRLFFRTRE